MNNCQSIEACPFFNDKMADKPATARSMKRRYCLGDYTACARYMVLQALGKGKVPITLFPNQTDKAMDLIN